MGSPRRWMTGLMIGAAVNVPVFATTLSYEVDSLGGSTWQYSYAVTNDTLGTDIELFTVYFALGLHENLVVGATPPGWDPLVDDPDPGLMSDGIYDVLALGAGIAPGDTLGGFTVHFNFLGAGVPGSQRFDVFDTTRFAVVDFGDTVAVPEPATLGLALLALSAGAARRRVQKYLWHALSSGTRALPVYTSTGGP